MYLNTKEMTGVPVRTRSGQSLGRVASFDLDDATGRLVNVHVKTGGIVSGLISDELLISWDAVVELSSEEVVVADASVQKHAHLFAQATTPATSGLMKEG